MCTDVCRPGRRGDDTGDGPVGCAHGLFKAHGGEIREVYGFWEHAAAPLPIPIGSHGVRVFGG